MYEILVLIQGPSQTIAFIKLVAVTTMDFCIGKTKRRLYNRKWKISRPFRNVITLLLLLITLKQRQMGPFLHFGLLFYFIVKETLFIQELQPAFNCMNVNVSSDTFLLYKESFSIVSLNRQFQSFETYLFSTADVFWQVSRPPLMQYK